MEYVKEIILEVDKENFLNITAQQLDTARVLNFRLLNNGENFSLSNRQVRFLADKPDNTQIFNDCVIVDAEKGQCKLKLTNQVLAKEGVVKCQLKISEGTDILKTAKFNIVVDSAINESNIESTNEFTVLDKALAKVDEYNKYFEETSGKIEEKYTARLDKLYYTALTGEIGVLNTQYKPGDVRRYGIFPDGKTNWNLTTDYITVIQENSANLGLEIFFPSGIYNTEFNLYMSNVSCRFEAGCEFTGLLHFGGVIRPGDTEVTKISNIHLYGDLVTYDRFGTFYIDGLTIDGNVHVKSVPEKALNYPGLRTRGCHIFRGTKNLRVNDIIVDDCDEMGFTNDAAISIDANDMTELIENINVRRMIVNGSDVHGVYLMGNGYHVDEIIVKEYGKGTYRKGQADDTSCIGAAPKQSRELKGVWLNRMGNSYIGKISVTNADDTRDNVRYDVMLDETGVAGNKGVNIGNIFITVKGKSRGLSINDRNYPSENSIYNIENIEISNTKATNEDGYYLLDICDFSKVNITNVNIVNSNQDNAIALRSRYLCTIKNIRLGDVKKQSVYVDGLSRIDNLELNRTANLDSKPTMYVTKKANKSIFGKLLLDCKTQLVVNALEILASYFSIENLTTGFHAGDAVVYFNGCLYSKIDYINLINLNTNKIGCGLKLNNISSVTFNNVTVMYFKEGINSIGTIARTSFSNSLSYGNSSYNTNISANGVALFNSTGITL